MSRFSPTFVLIVLAALVAVYLVEVNCSDDDDFWGENASTSSTTAMPCRKKIKQTYCITNGNKCGKDNDCCRNLFCTKTKKGSVCSRRPRQEEDYAESPQVISKVGTTNTNEVTLPVVQNAQ